ncbi:hypothetical protein [Saccharothrix obliqua]|uniref:hypothetical protein n=1 Tax=Saccharothrix obliqua TaxID=2861747 RepID=UPI001C5E1F43|nr:hypothetical protein [Saccharothrix obliqua]MBW4716752.1 hypothetical protein [Saccharothrix obliqua]
MDPGETWWERLDAQIDLTTLGTGYVQEAHERFEAVQDALMGGEAPPSERVVDLHRAERTAPTHPHPGAESTTANLAAGPVATLFDRVKDAVRAAVPDDRR